ncbi:MAG: sugar transferase [Chloroflexi bacterium]|nr:sugar transferase [Chloroflexota bacterium]
MTYQDQAARRNEDSERRLYNLTKRIFDVVVALTGLFFIAPVFLVICVLIKLDSPGPILHRQKRIGRWGKPFGAFKFRTMLITPDQGKANPLRADEGEVFLKTDNDPRVARVGRVLRKTSLDELPQLLNVLRGEMSLVGPRPPLAYEFEFYKDWHKRRLEVIPGVTGLWQVQRSGNLMSFDEMVKLDIWYIEHRSFWLDLKILLDTIPAALRGQGAY